MWLALTCGVLLALATQSSEALAVSWGPGVKAALPADAGSKPDVALSSVSCASAGDCSAVGSYANSSRNRRGLLLTERGGAWASGVKAALPTNAGSNPGVHLDSVSCASAGDCTAVGSYIAQIGHSGLRQGLLIGESGGAWVRGVEADLPADAGFEPGVRLNSVSCASPGDCSAVGSYLNSSFHRRGLLLSESDGAWTAGVRATVPADATSNPNVQINSVSCASAGDCGAVGSYTDGSGQQGLLLSESGGTWAAGTKAALPADAVSGPRVTLGSVSCASPGNCSAVGSYQGLGHRHGLLLSESGGTWAAGVKVPLPAGAGPNPNVGLPSVSCASAGNCSAVGIYFAGSSYHHHVLLLSESGGTWAAVEATLPADADAGSNLADLSSVSCASAGDCSAVGSYADSSGNRHGLLLSESGGVWAAGVKAAPPADAGSKPDVALNSVSCASAGRCSAVGSYADSSRHPQGLLLGAPPPPNTKVTEVKISQQKRKATFKFKAKGNGKANGFQCRLHRKGGKSKDFKKCTSPRKYKDLREGKYVFKVRAKGPGGKDPSPATKKFKIKK